MSERTQAGLGHVDKERRAPRLDNHPRWADVVSRCEWLPQHPAAARPQEQGSSAVGVTPRWRASGDTPLLPHPRAPTGAVWEVQGGRLWERRRPHTKTRAAEKHLYRHHISAARRPADLGWSTHQGKHRSPGGEGSSFTPATCRQQRDAGRSGVLLHAIDILLAEGVRLELDGTGARERATAAGVPRGTLQAIIPPPRSCRHVQGPALGAMGGGGSDGGGSLPQELAECCSGGSLSLAPATRGTTGQQLARAEGTASREEGPGGRPPPATGTCTRLHRGRHHPVGRRCSRRDSGSGCARRGGDAHQFAARAMAGGPVSVVGQTLLPPAATPPQPPLEPV